MSNWYCSRESVRGAAKLMGVDRDPEIDTAIEAASRAFDRRTRRFFIPKTETRLYRWPNRNGVGHILWTDQDLLSVSTLQAKAQDSSPTTISSSDFFLEPYNVDPKNRIEIDLSSTAAFEAGDTSQRSISVAGSWGFSDTTRSTGTVVSGLASSASDTTMVCSDAELIDVGDTLLIESEQVFVADRDFAALDSILVDDADVQASHADDTITLDGSHGIAAREVIRLDSEELYVRRVSTNDLTFIRGYNGTTLAAHSNNTAVHINRTLTIERGINGTTAATHANSTATSKYEPPFDVQQVVRALALSVLSQEAASWGRVIGVGENVQAWAGVDIGNMWEQAVRAYRKPREATI